MTNNIFLFGTIAGLAAIGMMVWHIATSNGQLGDHSVLLGYLVMIVALTMIFFGVKRYRDRELGGVIKFAPAFLMGLAITVVAGVIYVAGWEVYEAATGGAYFDAYVAHAIEEARAGGMAQAELDKMIAEMNGFKAMYQNPLFRMPMVFLEIFPVGVIISVISAVVLRNPRMLAARV
jgi:hypothetical protein